MKRLFLLLILPILIFILLLAGGYLWWQENLKSVSRDQKAQIFVVKKGEGLKEIAKDLKIKNLIKNSLAFIILVKKLDLQKNIQAGDFRLSPSYPSEKIIKELTHGTLDVWITIPEGWRNEEIAQKLLSDLNIFKMDFLKVAKEGYMYPDTYLFPKDADAGMIARIMIDNFHKRIQSIEPDAFLDGKKFNGLTLGQIVILASLVEREAKFAEDRPLVSGILVKRFKNDWPLEVDAALQYILGFDAKENSWWRKNLTLDDLKIDSAYNTRKHRGFPPTPIGNSGLLALKAAFHPKESEFWFYLSDSKGKMHYAKTIEEHTANIRKYLSN